MKISLTNPRVGIYCALALLAIAFLLRFYAAATTPLMYDEQDYIELSKEIDVFPNIFNLKIKGVSSIRSPEPIWNKDKEGVVRYYLPMLAMLNFSRVLFGDTVVGMRLLFIIFGVCSLFFIYKLIAEEIDSNTALFALAILTFSQLHIGVTKGILDTPYHFFITLSIYAFFRALRTGRNSWAYFTGISIGLGFLYYPWIISLVPVFLIFLIIEKKYRVWLTRKATYLAFFIVLSVIITYFLWAASHFAYKMTVSKPCFQLGFSLRVFYFYFAELFAKLSEKFGILCWDGLNEALFIATAQGKRLIGEIDIEWPVMDWVSSVLIFIGCLYSFKHKKNDLIKFSLIMFCFLVIVISIVNGQALVLDHSWANITLYPGVILCVNLLMNIGGQRKVFYFFRMAFIIYLVINSLRFINIPENFYGFPKNELCRLYLSRAEFYLNKGEDGKAERVCRWIIKNKPTNKEFILKAEKVLAR